MGFVSRLQSFQASHNRFVKRIHTFRIPLPPWGVTVMKFVYFSTPVFAGYQAYLYALESSEAKWASKRGVVGAGVGVEGNSNTVHLFGKDRKVGAGGVGGGGHLVESNAEEQRRIMRGLERVLKASGGGGAEKKGQEGTRRAGKEGGLKKNFE